MKAQRLILAAAAVLAALSTLSRAASSGTATSQQERIEKKTIVESPGRPEARRESVTFLGVDVAPAPAALAAQLRLPEGQGLVVQFVAPESPAEKAGVKRHDLLLKLDDQILIDPHQLAVLVRGRKEGEKVNLTYVRAGQEARAAATLETRERPAGDPGRIGGALTPPHFEHQTGWPLSEEQVDRLREMERRIDRQFERLRVPAPPAAPGTPRPPQVRIFRPKTDIVLTDEGGTLELRSDEADQILRASDAEGNLIFEGPIDTPEQRAALPEVLRGRLQKLERLEVAQPPAPPAPPAPVAPMAPTGRAI